MSLIHPIQAESFAIIDREIGQHDLSLNEYEIVRRVIHSTADFDFVKTMVFSHNAIEKAIKSLQEGAPIITDVTMVKQGIITLVEKTFKNPVVAAVEYGMEPLPGKTRTETGMLKCLAEFPAAIIVIGNAPTALLAICSELDKRINLNLSPAVIIGAPVGFVSVLESKAALAAIDIPQIRVEGRKGGSPVAAAILNALILIAWHNKHS